MENSIQGDKTMDSDVPTENTASVTIKMPPVQHQHGVCSPITALEHVWEYVNNPPKWINRIVELVPRGKLVVKNKIFDCHIESEFFAPNVRLERQSVPRTLVCHDMKGGYLEDKFVDPVNVGNGYAFYRWAQIDVFVYFSHHLVTIPPLSWINIAHSNGVKILGTFITEWTPGEAICEEIFKNMDTLQAFVDALVNISVLFKLDGWLLNFENKLKDTSSLQQFVKSLTEQMHQKRPGSLVIWYDSVIQDGTLKWQNELNELNRCFFDVCDGIFVNYTWNEDNLKKSVQMAQHRCLDVYVGVDVFGRNFFGGGCFNTYLAVEKIRQYNLSMAVFAQGWTHETLPFEPSDNLLERFLDRDSAFWRSLWPYLYTHPISTTFQTFFYVGVDKDWFKLLSQEVQPSKFLHSRQCLVEAVNVPTLVASCNCLQIHVSNPYTSCLITKEKLKSSQSYVHHLFSCDIRITGHAIIYYYVRNTLEHGRNDYLNLILLVRNANDAYKKIVCRSIVQENLLNNASILEVNPSSEESIINVVTVRQVPKDWILRCYVIEIKGGKILEIGAEIDRGHSVCLCGLGITEVNLMKK